MGFFDSVKGFFNDVGNKVKSGFDTAVSFVSNNAPTVYNDLKGAVTWVADKGASVVTATHDDVKTFITGQQGIVNNLIGTTGGVIYKGIDTAGSTIQGLGSSLSFPLLIAGGAVLLIMLKK
jgi:phage-related protein